MNMNAMGYTHPSLSAQRVTSSKNNPKVGTSGPSFQGSFDEARMKYYDTYIKGNASPVTLTDEQIKALATKYDPENMSQEEYVSFIDDLVQSGVVSAAEKNFIDYGEFVCLGTPEEMLLYDGMTVTSNRYKGESIHSLSEANGNVLRWAKHTASWLGLNQVSSGTNMFNLRSASVFKKIAPILEQMQASRS